MNAYEEADTWGQVHCCANQLGKSHNMGDLNETIDKLLALQKKLKQDEIQKKLKRDEFWDNSKAMEEVAAWISSCTKG